MKLYASLCFEGFKKNIGEMASMHACKSCGNFIISILFNCLELASNLFWILNYSMIKHSKVMFECFALFDIIDWQIGCSEIIMHVYYLVVIC